MADIYRVQTEPIQVEPWLRELADPGVGAYACFVGVVRNEFEGRASAGLHYDAYPALAEKEMRRIGEEIKRAYALTRVVMVHRLGALQVGDVAVLVAVSAPHRGEALRGCEVGIDRLKERVPIFKRELWADGTSAWHGEPGGPPGTVPRVP